MKIQLYGENENIIKNDDTLFLGVNGDKFLCSINQETPQTICGYIKMMDDICFYVHKNKNFNLYLNNIYKTGFNRFGKIAPIQIKEKDEIKIERKTGKIISIKIKFVAS